MAISESRACPQSVNSELFILCGISDFSLLAFVGYLFSYIIPDTYYVHVHIMAVFAQNSKVPTLSVIDKNCKLKMV